MRSRDLVGKTIARVVQSRVEATSGRRIWCLEALQLTDGRWLRFMVVESESDYGVRPIYPARPEED